MHTVPESTATVQFDQALTEMARRATATCPQAAPRIARALALVEADAVTDRRHVRPHWFTVRSYADPATAYDVVSHGQTTCTCVDYYAHATADNGFLCKHGWAVLLVRSLQREARGQRLVHAYHMASGEEGHGRRLVGGRAVFHPGGHAHSVLCMAEELCFGPPVHREEGV
jgi:hypothetical protein